MITEVCDVCGNSKLFPRTVGFFIRNIWPKFETGDSVTLDIGNKDRFRIVLDGLQYKGVEETDNQFRLCKEHYIEFLHYAIKVLEGAHG